MPPPVSRGAVRSNDPRHFVRERHEYEEKRDEFILKFLHRVWPVRLVIILGVLQLVIILCLLGVDFPVMLMLAPRWEVLVGCWMFIAGFIASISTIHSGKKRESNGFLVYNFILFVFSKLEK